MKHICNGVERASLCASLHLCGCGCVLRLMTDVNHAGPFLNERRQRGRRIIKGGTGQKTEDSSHYSYIIFPYFHWTLMMKFLAPFYIFLLAKKNSAT